MKAAEVYVYKTVFLSKYENVSAIKIEGDWLNARQDWTDHLSDEKEEGGEGVGYIWKASAYTRAVGGRESGEKKH